MYSWGVAEGSKSGIAVGAVSAKASAWHTQEVKSIPGFQLMSKRIICVAARQQCGQEEHGSSGWRKTEVRTQVRKL